MGIFCGMKQQKIHCVVIDKDAAATASLDTALRSANVLLDIESLSSVHQLIPVLSEKKPHLLFCPQPRKGDPRALLEVLQRHSPDTLLIWLSQQEWQGLTTWLVGVESCTLPMNDPEYFGQYVDFLLHYSAVKQDFRQCKHLLSVAELRCHWLVDYSWEPIAYIAQGMHLYANHAYVTIFGFESLAEVRSMPIAGLVDAGERKVFESMSHAVDYGNKASNRLLTTLRTLDGQVMRAEIRFIPAVLKGQRCTQLHVRPLETPVRGAGAKAVQNPWCDDEAPVLKATADAPKIVEPTPAMTPESLAAAETKVVEIVAPKAEVVIPSGGFKPPHLPRMRAGFGKSMKLASTMPTLLFAEPCFRQQDGRISTYETLLQHLKDSDGRFRLDYWNVGQVIAKLASHPSKNSSYLIFVSVGDAIFNNESYLKHLLELLQAHPLAAKQIVVALRYEDCVAYTKQLSKVLKLLNAMQVQLAVDELPDLPQAVKLVQTIKPSFARLLPELVTRIEIDADVLARLQRLTRQLSDLHVNVIASGVNDMSSLNLLCATSAAYLQGAMFQK